MKPRNCHSHNIYRHWTKFHQKAYLRSVLSKNCVPLKDCQSLMNLVRNRDSLPNMTRVDVYEYVKELSCGFEGSKPLVNCPDFEGNITNLLLNLIFGKTCSKCTEKFILWQYLKYLWLVLIQCKHFLLLLSYKQKYSSLLYFCL